jgi:hypothetical protein
MLAIILMTGMATPALADEGDTAEVVASETETMAVQTELPVLDYPSVNPVYINGNSYFTLQNVVVFQGIKGRVASVTLSLHNGGSQEIKAADYWLRLENKSGDRYSVQITVEDKAIDAVPPQTDTSFTYFAQVGSQTQPTDLVITPFKWDFSVSGFESSLGSFNLGDDYTSLTPAGSARLIRVSDQSVKAYVFRPQVLKGPVSQLATVALKVENAGSLGVTIPSLSFYLKTDSGDVYTLETDTPGKLQLQPNASDTYIVSGSIPVSVDVTSGELVVAMTDSAAKSDYPVASFELPDLVSGASQLTPTGVVLPVDIDGNYTDTWVDKVTSSRYVDKTQVGLYYNWENKSNTTVTLPDFGFLLRTSDGSTYPMKVSGVKGATVRPKELKHVQATVILPSGVTTDDLSLIVYTANNAGSDKKLIFPVAMYKVDPSSEGGQIGNSAQFTNQDGLYQININGLQRIPWQDQDQITVSLDLVNNGDASLPIPDLAAYFELDGVAKVNARIVQTDDNLLLPARGKMNFMAIGNVPYQNQFQAVNLVLQEKVADVTDDLANFDLPTGSASLPIVPPGEAWNFTTKGSQTAVKIYDLHTYSKEFDSTSTFFVELEIDNTEKRFNELTRWVGYFKASDDVYFPATISEYRQKVSPGGKVLLSLYGKMPRTYTWDQLQILIGQAVTGTKLSSYGKTDASGKAAADPTPDGLVNAVLLTMPGEAVPAMSYTNMRVGPYYLSLSNIAANVDTKNSLTFNFDYTLSKDTDFETSLDGHQFIIVFTSGAITFEQKVGLEDANGLIIGDGSYQFKKNQPSIFKMIPGLDHFQLQLYDEFQGQRRLLADKDLQWFQTYDGE